MNQLNSSMLSSIPPAIERYELKYVIPYAMIAPISEYLAPYCVYDNHSMAFDDRFYPVNSLYFDTVNYRFLKLRKWGIDRRFNMRVRAYGDGTEGPYFAEVKYKTPTCVRKFRATLLTSEWPTFLKSAISRSYAGAHNSKETSSRALFQQLAEAYAIEPKIFTCYRRRAFVSTIDEYARVTFDIDMRYRPQDPLGSSNCYSLSPDGACINYDAQGVYDEESHYSSNVIMELKSSVGTIPVWMVELIRRFELKQVGFSKYLNSTETEHFDNGWNYMAGDRSGELLQL